MSGSQNGAENSTIGTSNKVPSAPRNERGFTLIAVTVMIFVLIGMLALAFDLGRAYLAKN